MQLREEIAMGKEIFINKSIKMIKLVKDNKQNYYKTLDKRTIS